MPRSSAGAPPNPPRGRARLAACAAVLAAATGCDALALPAPPPTAFTSFAADNVPGLTERPAGADAGGDAYTVHASVPRIPGAGPLTERLTEIVDREAADFRDAFDDAESLEVDWELTAAGAGVIGVRTIRTETDHRGSHDAFSSYYYDVGTGRTAYATELLAGDAQLRELDGLVAAALADTPADPGLLHPGLRLYDSIGFNADGDLVVEFDAGELAPIAEGRVAAVVAASDAQPLLSELGERVLDASTRDPHAFSVDSAPEAAPTGGTEVPGTPPGGGDHACGTETACLALTFDDGPSENTGAILKILERHNARATFFMSGQAIRERPADVGRVRTAGHALGSHGETHEPFPDLTRAELDSELDAVDALVRRRTGERPDILRPPFGETDAAVAEAAAEHGQAQIVWDTDSEDWTGIGAEEIAANVAAVTPPGGLVLLHGTRDTTVAALPEILDRAESHGLTLVTVPDLLGDTEPGAVYYTADPAANEECIRLDGCPW
ncbi:polysaccharide deacetylase family protein [Streptomonospora salina]|uniref:Peptidoglycan/xylan/chitin deacetylase (PgdA/CDA1 family) n=1 Tax=Streptomonospora salina TaxID=104205 RepID=A0A841EGN9_9ACTN|nr:polysaccharide deacetylase family protein [Streptomonospora salina]MBB6000529.1 peptidoglycan/xylan/chitin deacetylase (PgdA/CDA1 family) [Streptomonospora salina]